jgi:hypothetical protein
MHLRRALLLAPLLACSPATSDSDATTDIPVMTSGSTSAPETTTTEDPTTTASASDATSADPSTTSDDPTTTTDTTIDPPATTSTTSTTADTTTADDTTTGVLEELPPIDSVEVLEAWLAGGAYKQWAVESVVHPSTGPHAGNVRTYVNAIALQSLADGDPEHPTDAATVKELYGNSFDTIIGYAVSRKTQPESLGGDTWYWYERVNATTYGGELGTPLCTGCHGGGADYILTPYPLQ